MAHIINLINKVEFIEAHHLVHCDVIHERGVLFNVEQLFTEIPLKKQAQAKISEKIENGEHVFTTEVVVSLLHPFRADGRRLCFRLTAVGGCQYLVGLSDAPFPVVTCDESFPASPTGKQVPVLKVTWTALTPMLIVLD